MADFNLPNIFPDIVHGISSGVSTGLQQLTDAIGLNGGEPDKDNSLGQDKYDFNSRVFPLDLASNVSYHGHYMVININVQNESKLSKINGVNVFTRLDNDYSKTDVLRYNIDPRYINDTGESFYAGHLQRPRFTKRIAESIALYMPSSELTFTDSHDYQNISLTKFATAVVAGTTGLMGAGIGSTVLGAAGSIFGPAGSVAGSIAGAGIGAGLGGAVSQYASFAEGTAQIMNKPVNPKVEVLYSNTFQRQFSFDFLFAPESEEESKALEQIIKTLRFHAAPEMRTGDTAITSDLGAMFWIPPSEFDITFFNRGKENTAIPRLNTMVLNQVDVSYSPTGAYATFTNGYPVQVRMVLKFTETETISKQRISQGF